MSKKRGLRTLSVGGVNYRWIVKSVDQRHIVLRVWAVDRKRRDYPLEVRARYDDPWLNYGPHISGDPQVSADKFQLRPLLPGIVREVIETCIALGWRPDHPERPRKFERNEHGKIVETGHSP